MITKDEIQELLRMVSSEDDVTSLSQALSQVCHKLEGDRLKVKHES